MADALVVTVHLLGEAYNGTGDWQPAPARLFQALVAGAARGRHIDETDRAVLRWLEDLAPPRIAAPHAVPVMTPTLYVPNNDLDGDEAQRLIKQGKTIDAAVSAVRVAKRTERRRIEAPAPILYVYAIETPPPLGIDDLAARLYRLGRGDDPAFATADVMSQAEAEDRLAAHPGIVHVPSGSGGVPVPVTGTLASLEERFARTLERFQIEGKGRRARTIFVQPPKALFGRVGYGTPPHRLPFDIVAGDRFAPVPLHLAAVLVDGLRKAAAERFAKDGVPAAERLIVGRGAGPDDLPRRVTVIPIPSIGHAETDPSIRRIEVHVPATCPLTRADVAWSFRGLVPRDPETGEVLADGALVAATDRPMGERYERPARRWRSITPLALAASRRRIPPDARAQAAKAGAERQAEDDAAAAHVRAALAQAGVRATPTAVRVQLEPFGRREAMAEAFAPGTRFAKHALWHADVTFDRPISGPLLCGDGRFTGLGLMRPVETVDGAFALAADRPLDDGAEALGAALRRAVMAAVRDVTGSHKLEAFFTGHAPSGEPLRERDRRHIACAADTPRQRFIVVAPHLIDSRTPRRDERRHAETLATALSQLNRLTAGRHGAFGLDMRPVEPDDVLFTTATTWDSISPYAMTRHPKGRACNAVAADVAAECRRRARPVPDVRVLSEDSGLRFRLRLTFPRPVWGPLFLGRTASRGGLFGPVAKG